MQNKQFHYLLDKLAHIGVIDREKMTITVLFGYYCLNYEGAVFASIHNSQLYLKGHQNYNSLFETWSMQQLVITHQMTQKALNYFQVTAQLWEDSKSFEQLLHLVVYTALEDHKVCIEKKGNRLKDLPNITYSLERILWRAGIKDVEFLSDLGAFEAFYQVKQIVPSISINVLFKLHCAIKRSHEQCLTSSEKNSLLTDYSLYATKYHAQKSF